MNVIGSPTKFAVARTDGKFEVGDLAHPERTTIESAVPAGAQLLDRSTFDANKSSADRLRQVVLGGVNVATAAQNPLSRGADLANSAGGRIEAWRAVGKPDSVSVDNAFPPPSLENLQQAIQQLGSVVSQPGFKAQFLAASPEQRAQLTYSMNALLDMVPQLSGVRAGETLSPLFKGLEQLNGFLFDTGGSRLVAIETGRQITDREKRPLSFNEMLVNVVPGPGAFDASAG